jgi:hypothetical protein
MLLPRHLQIIYEINARFLAEVRGRYGDDGARAERMSLIEEGPVRSVRMAHLAIVGSHSTNGVSELHSELVRTSLVPDLANYYPERFNNKTNGVTPRRWLMHANPGLSALITSGIGNTWITDLEHLQGLRALAGDAAFREAFLKTKREAKVRFAQWLAQASGPSVDPDSIFDCQIKRIHEYKRQLLNALHIMILYQRLMADRSLEMQPRTFFFAGKAAPSYHLAKVVIKLIHCLAARIAAEPRARDRIKVVFLPDYNVSLAERLIPATDVSEQLSTAGFEASGTGNMKFMMNGALTVGTRDGATLEMARQAGEENLFLFGLTAAEVAGSRGWYKPAGQRECHLGPSCELEVGDLLATVGLGRRSAEPGHGHRGRVRDPHRDLRARSDYGRGLCLVVAHTRSDAAAEGIHRSAHDRQRRHRGVLCEHPIVKVGEQAPAATIVTRVAAAPRSRSAPPIPPWRRRSGSRFPDFRDRGSRHSSDRGFQSRGDRPSNRAQCWH